MGRRLRGRWGSPAGLLAATALLGCKPPCEAPRVCTLAGTGQLGFNGDGLDPLETHLASPSSVRQAPDGGVVVVDFSNMRLRRIGEAVETVVGNGMHAYSEPGVGALETPLENPVDTRWGPDGHLYIAPLHEGRVIRVREGLIEVVVCTGESLEATGDGGPARDATMGYPGGIAFGDDGTMYVSDYSNHAVRAVRPDGTIETVAGTGERGFDAEGDGTAVRLDSPAQLEAEGGTLYVADSGNHRVGALDLQTGWFRTAAGTGEPGYVDGSTEVAQLDTPLGLAADGDTLFIADLANDVVRRLLDGELTTVVGGGEDEDGVTEPLERLLKGPGGLELTDDGDLLIADRSGHRVLRWVR